MGYGGTTLYDAVYLCSNLVTKKQTGRKALVLLTDGEDNGSRTSINDAIEAAQRADTLVYSILFSDETFGGRRTFGPDGKKVLQKMSRETGGGFFRGIEEARSGCDLCAAAGRTEEPVQLRVQAGRTGRPAKPFHAIKLATRRKGLVVQATSGYYAQREGVDAEKPDLLGSGF